MFIDAEAERLQRRIEASESELRRTKDENRHLRAVLARMHDEFAASLNSGKAVGYTAGSMQRALRIIRESSAALTDDTDEWGPDSAAQALERGPR
jgi:hypothetical protein